MSNDLISRSALFEEISSYIFDGVNPDTRRGEHAAKAHICELIDRQPTAYDVDKVVEQIKKCDYCDSNGYLEPEAVITIVKDGGVNV